MGYSDDSNQSKEENDNMTLIADIGLEVAIYKVDKGCLEITLIPWSGGKTTIPSFQMFGN
jgi:hypothetical protein